MSANQSVDGIIEYKWSGSINKYVDEPHIAVVSEVIVGLYGGNSSAGAEKNEDAALVWVQRDRRWEFVMLLDAHHTSQSADYMLQMLESRRTAIINLLNGPAVNVFHALHDDLLAFFTSETFLSGCRELTGETSCMLCVRRGAYLWWLNVGDCLVHLLHPELLRFGQSALNQRNFYEWVGYVNTFDKPVPGYSTGVRELREGRHVVLLTTDGILELESGLQEHYGKLCEGELASVVHELLTSAHQHGIKDSTTIIAWPVMAADHSHKPSYPSDGDRQHAAAKLS